MSLQPPPRHVHDFNFQWKDWLYFLYSSFSNSTGVGITGPFGFTLKSIATSTDSPYTVGADDIVLLVNPDTANCTVNLPAISSVVDGRIIWVKNIDVAATGYTVVLTRASSDVIDDGVGGTATTLPLAAATSVPIVADSTNSTWWIL